MFNLIQALNYFSKKSAGNEQNMLRIYKRKNGINPIEEYPILVPTNKAIELAYNY